MTEIDILACRIETCVTAHETAPAFGEPTFDKNRPGTNRRAYPAKYVKSTGETTDSTTT